VTENNVSPGNKGAETPWLEDPAHRDWLRTDALRQIDFFRRSLRGDGGFDALDIDGSPIPDAPQELHATTRMVHSYAMAHVAGAPDCTGLIEAGLDYIWSTHRDGEFGGYLWSLHHDGRIDRDVKLAYGHVFVLLAASSAKAAGFDQADPILADITQVIETRFLDARAGLLLDEFTRDWQPFSDYRGYNANMHGCEAFMAAYEATGEAGYLDKAGSILDFFTARIAPAHDWRIPEHFAPGWTVDMDYEGDPMFRPRGTTPGHSFELARLLLQYWDLRGRPGDEMPARARALMQTALDDGWVTEGGGFVYTLDYGHAPQITDRYWWPVTEAIGVLASFLKIEARPEDEAWYRKVWGAAADLFVDTQNGGWIPEVDDAGRPVARQFSGKPDIYHALQAELLPLAPGLSRSMKALSETRPLVP
jgi:mannose/cellobiose epimerase-like protein (N-acyl-D-glucosamine 2-epimerase family)